MSPKLGARTRATRLVSLSVVAFAVLGGSARAAAPEAAGETFAASVTAAGELAQPKVSNEVDISADGQFIAFLSKATNLSPEATTWNQAYVKDLGSGALVLASRATGVDGEPADEPVGGGGVERPRLSADGHYLAFESHAENLAAAVPPGGAVTHVFRRDLETGQTEVVDRVDGPGGEVLPTAARVLAISADGNLVAFSDAAAGMAEPTGAAPGEETIYVRDLETGVTTEVAAEGAEEASFSADGRYLLFTSPAALDPESNGIYQVYRRDLLSGATVLVSRGAPTGGAPLGEPADGEAYEAVFVGGSDCEVAFFAVGTTDLTPGGGDPATGIYLRDFCSAAPSTTLLSFDPEGEPLEEVGHPTATEAGAVAFEGEVFEGTRHLYLSDPATGATTLLDRASGVGGQVARIPVEPRAVIAASGCRAVFASASGDLLAGEPNLSEGPQAIVRQLAPCVPTVPVEVKSTPVPDEGAKPAPSGAGGAAGATSVRARGFGRQVVWLEFDGPGRSRLRIQKLVSGHHHGWHEVRDLVATAAAAGPVKVAVPTLAPGRYRLRFRLQGDPDNPTTTRLLTVRGG